MGAAAAAGASCIARLEVFLAAILTWEQSNTGAQSPAPSLRQHRSTYEHAVPMPSLPQEKEKYDELIARAFSTDKQFVAALNSAFEHFLNLNARSPEYISLFMDDKLRKGLKVGGVERARWWKCDSTTSSFSDASREEMGRVFCGAGTACGRRHASSASNLMPHLTSS